MATLGRSLADSTAARNVARTYASKIDFVLVPNTVPYGTVFIARAKRYICLFSAEACFLASAAALTRYEVSVS